MANQLEEDLKRLSIDDEIDTSKYNFICKTVQSNAIKTLAESLKDVIIDTNLKINSKGMEILTSNKPVNTALVQLKLIAKCFEYFYCAQEQSLGLKIKSLYILLKTISNNDVITMYVLKSDITRLVIEIENKEKNIKDVSKLKLLDIDEDECEIGGIDFDRVIKMPSTDFQKICKELSNIADIVNIEVSGNIFKMSVDGTIGEKEVIVQKNNQVYVNGSAEEVHIIQKYALKFLLLFVKSSNLCSTVEIFIKDNYPLVLIYSIGSLGSLKFLLVPFNSE